MMLPEIEPPPYYDNLVAALGIRSGNVINALSSEVKAAWVNDNAMFLIRLRSQADAHEFFTEQGGGYDCDTGVADEDYVAFDWFCTGDLFIDVGGAKLSDMGKQQLYACIEKHSLLSVFGVSEALGSCRWNSKEEEVRATLPGWALNLKGVAEGSNALSRVPGELRDACRALEGARTEYIQAGEQYQGIRIDFPANNLSPILLGVGAADGELDPVRRVCDDIEQDLLNEFNWTANICARVDHQFGVSDWRITVEMIRAVNRSITALCSIADLLEAMK